MKSSKGCLCEGLVIRDFLQNNKKIVLKNIEYAAHMFAAEYGLNSM